ncbi:hypothetical protein MRX96_007643 [Rhipicephalus microplus]
MTRSHRHHRCSAVAKGPTPKSKDVFPARRITGSTAFLSLSSTETGHSKCMSNNRRRRTSYNSSLVSALVVEISGKKRRRRRIRTLVFLPEPTKSVLCSLGQDERVQGRNPAEP